MPVRTSKEVEAHRASQVNAGAPKSAAPKVKSSAPKKSAPEPAKVPEPKLLKKKSQEWKEPFILAHPDSTENSPINTTILLDGEKVKVERGYAAVRDPGQRDALVRSGWRWVNQQVNVSVDPRWEAELKRFKEMSR